MVARDRVGRGEGEGNAGSEGSVQSPQDLRQAKRMSPLSSQSAAETSLQASTGNSYTSEPCASPWSSHSVDGVKGGEGGGGDRDGSGKGDFGTTHSVSPAYSHIG